MTRDGSSLLWDGACIVADFRRDQAASQSWLRGGSQCITGFEVLFLPEPVAADMARVSRGDAARAHRETFHGEMARLLRTLYDPTIYRAESHERNVGFLTVDLRITNGDFESPNGSIVPQIVSGSTPAPSRIRMFFLVKAVVEIAGNSINAQEEGRRRAAEFARLACQKLRAVAPRDLPLRSLNWGHGDQGCYPGGGPTFDRPEALGLSNAAFGNVAELRRELLLSTADVPLDYENFCRRVLATESASDRLWTAPQPWPETSHDLLPTCGVLSAARSPVVVSLRLQPTMKTPDESKLVNERLALLSQRDSTSTEPVRRELERFARERDFFLSSVQVAGAEASVVVDVLNTLMGEQVTNRPRRQIRNGQGRGLARVTALTDHERRVANFNLARMEFIPWGACSPAVHEQSLPAGTPPPDAPNYRAFDTVSELRKPEVFLERDVESARRLARLRMMLTLPEAATLWRLPVVMPGGQAGLVSRFPNPFEQLPPETPPHRDAVSFGRVQWRGVETTQEFRIPLVGGSKQTESLAPVAGIGDRVIVVAGSPGSGKTNFCLYFLRQLWKDSNKDEGRINYPFLVIDPTRGNEFRSLARNSRDVVIFTVGDGRYVPFCFNPFLVPKNVSVQTHISRLMSCFRAAYHMWDPLPQIFEMSIRRAYQGRRKDWWEKLPQNKAEGLRWSPAEDFPASVEEPFPTLTDIVAAMGRGGDEETFELDGKPTVMREQMTMWGKGTENAGTILAQTVLRLENLQANYGHIIGQPAKGRSWVDIAKLLEIPAVLEMGMVGDSQALSLMMGFLITVAAGTIESRPKSAGRKIHMMVIEEAHRLLSGEGSGGSKEGSSSKAQAAEDLNNMLAEVRKYGQGVMLLDQRPGSLVGGVIDNAYVIAMHRLNEEKSFKQFSNVLNLSVDQQRFARTELKPGEMITLDRRTGLPVLVRPPNERTDRVKLRDQRLSRLMRLRGQVAKLGLAAPPVPPTIDYAATARADQNSMKTWEALIAALKSVCVETAISDEALRGIRAAISQLMRVSHVVERLSINAQNRRIHSEGMIRAALSELGMDQSFAGKIVGSRPS